MSTSLLGGITFVVVFAGIILLHELGHFVVARLVGIEVEEFGVGFPPRIFRLWRSKGSIVIGKDRLVIPRNFDLPFDHKTIGSRLVNATADSIRGKLVLRTIALAATEDGLSRPEPVPEYRPDSSGMPLRINSQQEKLPKRAAQTGTIPINGILNEIRPGTEFTLNWIPLGGFNKIKGEDDPSLKGGMAAANPWKRIPVLMAGAAMNVLTAVFVYTLLFSQIGIPNNQAVMIMSVASGSPAEQAGLKANDIVLRAGEMPIEGNLNQLIALAHASSNKPMTLVILRDSQKLEITVTPRATYPANQGPIGISIGNPLSHPKTWFETIPISFEAAGSYIQTMLALPGQIIAGTVSPQEAQIGGPRSIWNLFQQSVQRDVTSRTTSPGSQSKQPTNYTLGIIISLTLTVGVVNLLPIPALDGWRIFTTLVEIVMRRPIPARYQAAINSIGFLVLLTLLAVFYIKDIISPIPFTLP